MIPIENPATGEILGNVPDHTADDVNTAVASARQAFQQGVWRAKNPSEREATLWRIAALIEDHAEDLALLESLETGKTLKDARSGDVGGAIDAFRYYAGAVRRLGGRTIPVDGKFTNRAEREPLGVIGAIVPWNYPLCLAAWKLAPALASGNSVVLKPSELTPFTTLKLLDLIHEAGVPKGVVHLLTGYGRTTGDAIARHPDIDKVVFTGSGATARRIMIAAAESNLKPVALELGGKSANIVFASADLKAAVRGALWGIFGNAGQVCSAGSRLLLERPIYDEFVQTLAARTAKLRLGNPQAQTTDIGSLISRPQMERVLGFIEQARADGATIVCGGQREPSLPQGYFVQPTLLTGVRESSPILLHEVFGPVLCILPFDTEENAIALANGTSYGLAAGVWTANLAQANRVSAALAAGTVWINAYNEFDSASPFGGVKQSGFGRDLGEEALVEYTQTKSIWTAQ
jgi:acyl-CoA reductase-like NAD-dependent aldehyde dehydrogenase